MKKTEAREYMKMLRKRLSEQERKKRNAKIRENLFQMEQIKRAKWFYPFVSYGTEVDTIEIIKQVLQEGKCRVAVPRVYEDTMDFYVIDTMEQLQTGYKGILEPVTQTKVMAEDGVMLLPGLAFDNRKNRVGYGGGYYDRYLERIHSEKLVTVALAYEFQITGAIDAEDFDIGPQWIVTDKRVF